MQKNHVYGIRKQNSPPSASAFNKNGLASDFNSNVVQAVRYSVEALLIFLLASVDDVGGAMALGLFVGLVYSKQNLLILAPVYVIACAVFALSWWTLLYCVIPVVLLSGLYAVFYKLKRNVPVWAVALCALVSSVPYAVCTALFTGGIFTVVLSLVIVAVFSFCCSIAGYAILIRRINCHFTLDEQICGGIFLAVFAYALSSIHIENFYIYFTVLAFIVLLCSDCLSPACTVFTAVLFGAGASIGFGDLTPLGSAVVWAVAAVTVSSFTRFASGAALMAADALLWLLSGYSGSGWQTLVMAGLGVALYFAVPRGARMKLRKMSGGRGEAAFSGIVNKNRKEISSRLYSVSDVFYDMSKTLEKTEGAGCFSASALACEIAKNYCGKCADRESCFAQLGGDTSPVIEPMAKAVLQRGKATILDTPPFITSRCSKMHNLVSVVNSAGEAYRKRKEQFDGMEIGKKLMSEQFAGMALILDSLARESGEQVNFCGELADGVRNELLRHNIVASEVVVSGRGDSCRVTLTVREADAEKAVLARIVSAKLKTRLETVDVNSRGDAKVVHLAPSPSFEVAYGIAQKNRGANDVSGDSKSILCPSRLKRLFALSDGMGSGESASKSSRDAIGMVENFYRAGFDNTIILSLVNKLLRLTENDTFSSLDIAVIDTVSGGMDIIKMGAADSFIIHKDCIEQLSSSSPPAGILDGVQPLTDRIQLYDGDMVLMMSDGVFDALDTKGVTDAVDALGTSNPQTLADGLLNAALANGAEDDCTVLALRILCL